MTVPSGLRIARFALALLTSQMVNQFGFFMFCVKTARYDQGATRTVAGLDHIKRRIITRIGAAIDGSTVDNSQIIGGIAYFLAIAGNMVSSRTEMMGEALKCGNFLQFGEIHGVSSVCRCFVGFQS